MTHSLLPQDTDRLKVAPTEVQTHRQLNEAIARTPEVGAAWGAQGAVQNTACATVRQWPHLGAHVTAAHALELVNALDDEVACSPC